MGLLNRFKKENETEVTPKKATIKAPKKAVGEKAAVKEDKKEETVKDVTTKREAKMGDENYSVLVRPLVSEKAAIAEGKNTYTFIVKKAANKNQVSSAVKAIYKVKPVKIRIINVDGKILRRGRKTGRRSDWKKAMVTLPAGRTINIHEGV